MNSLRNSKGVSITELVIVVGVLAVLSAIAVPSYRAARARAIQKEGFALLSEYYRGSKTMIAEYGFTPGNLVAVGFNPPGVLYYRIEAADSAANPPLGYPNDDGCVATNSTCNFEVEPTLFTEGGSACGSGQTPTAAGKTFDAFACSNIPGGNGASDILSITEDKQLDIVQDGVN